MSCNCQGLNAITLELVASVESKGTAINDVLFTTVADLKRDSYLDSNLFEDVIRVAILHIQRDIVLRIVGNCLAEQLQMLICSGLIDHPYYHKYKELLINYLYPIFIYGVPVEIGIPLSFKDRNAGRIRQTDDDYNQSALSELKYTNQWYLDRVNFYINEAINFLKCNHTCFKELCGCCRCGCHCNVAPFNRPYKIGISTSFAGIKRPYEHYRLWKGYHQW